MHLQSCIRTQHISKPIVSGEPPCEEQLLHDACALCVWCALFPIHGYEDVETFMMSFLIGFFHHMLVRCNMRYTPEPLSSSNGLLGATLHW